MGEVLRYLAQDPKLRTDAGAALPATRLSVNVNRHGRRAVTGTVFSGRRAFYVYVRVSYEDMLTYALIHGIELS